MTQGTIIKGIALGVLTAIMKDVAKIKFGVQA